MEIKAILIILRFYFVKCSDLGTDSVSFLRKYGYINNDIQFDPQVDSNNGSSPAQNIDVSSAIKRFQDFVGINVTGEIDDDTVQWMKRPRCGVQDVQFDSSGAQPFKVNYLNRRELLFSQSFVIDLHQMDQQIRIELANAEV